MLFYFLKFRPSIYFIIIITTIIIITVVVIVMITVVVLNNKDSNGCIINIKNRRISGNGEILIFVDDKKPINRTQSLTFTKCK